MPRLLSFKSLREKVVSLQGQLKDSQSMLHTMRGERDAVRRQLTDRNDKLTQISQTLDAAKAEFDRTKQEAAEAIAEKDRLSHQFSEQHEEAKDLQNRVDNLLDNLHAREHELAQAQAKLKVSGELASASGPKVEALAADLATARAKAEDQCQGA
jgi:chromosome segregation ATPase